MLWVTVIFGVCSLMTGLFIVLELNWSIQNLMRLWNRCWGPLKILAIILSPLCFMPVILDVIITLGVTMLLGAEGMMGLMASMVVASTVAGYLYYMRRKHGWQYI